MSNICKENLRSVSESSSCSAGSSTDSDVNKVSIDNFELLAVIGKGAFGKVFLGRKKDGHDKGKLYAIKTLLKSLRSKRNALFSRERNILITLRHPFLVELLYAFQSEAKFYFVMEYASGGELYEVFHRPKQKYLTEEAASFYIKEIILAIEYLHEHKILYRDLKLENVLVDRTGHVKLTDFGISKADFGDGELTYTFCGTRSYQSPEMLRRSGHGREVDWWSVGVLFYFLVTGHFPFNDSNDNRLIEIILLGAYARMPPRLTKDLQDLIAKLLIVDPRKRLGTLGAQQIKDHCFFQSTDWNNVLRGLEIPPFIPNLSSETDTSAICDDFTKEPPIDSLPSIDSLDLQNSYFVSFEYYASPFISDKSTSDSVSD